MNAKNLGADERIESLEQELRFLRHENQQLRVLRTSILPYADRAVPRIVRALSKHEMLHAMSFELMVDTVIGGMIVELRQYERARSEAGVLP